MILNKDNPHAKPRRPRRKPDLFFDPLRAFAPSRESFMPVFLLSLAIIIAPTLSASATDLQLGGHLKSLNIHLQSPPRSGLSSGEVSSNRLRLDVKGSVFEDSNIELSAENILLYSDPPGLLPLFSASVNRTLDLEKNWNEGGRFQDQLFVDRFNLRIEKYGSEWTFGRQAVGFGRIAMFSPLDVIAPFPPDALDTDVRPGVDALRGVHYFGLGGQVGAIAVFGDEKENNSYLATFSLNTGGIDLIAIAGSLREREMGGFGLAGSLGGLGLKGEVTYYEGKEVGKAGGDLHDTFAIGAVETWYRFDNGLILLSEYLYNGAGAGDPEEYGEFLISAPLREGLSFLAGRHYLLAGPSYEVHPLLTVSGTLIWNLEDDSFFLRPLGEYSVSDNMVLQVFWSFSRGRKPKEVFGIPVPRSEFGSAGDSGGIFLKYFF
jgi:hypothetical protein